MPGGACRSGVGVAVARGEAVLVCVTAGIDETGDGDKSRRAPFAVGLGSAAIAPRAVLLGVGVIRSGRGIGALRPDWGVARGACVALGAGGRAAARPGAGVRVATAAVVADGACGAGLAPANAGSSGGTVGPGSNPKKSSTASTIGRSAGGAASVAGMGGTSSVIPGASVGAGVGVRQLTSSSAVRSCVPPVATIQPMPTLRPRQMPIKMPLSRCCGRSDNHNVISRCFNRTILWYSRLAAGPGCSGTLVLLH